MRTMIIIVGGFALLGLSVLIGRLTAGALPSTAALSVKYFIPIWLIVAAINMWLGVSRAGYSVAEEFPIFLVIFAIPTALAAFLWWKYSHG